MDDPAPAAPSHIPLTRNPWTLAALLAMPLFFAINLVVGRAVAGIVAPWSLAFWRWLIAAAVLLPFAAPVLLRHRTLLLAQWKRILVLAFLSIVLCGGGVYLALESTTATNATLIYTTTTIMIVVIEAILARRRLPLMQLIGTMAGFAGIALITVHGEWQRLLELRFNDGDLGILLAAISWTFYSLMLRSGPLVQLGAVPVFSIVALTGVLLLAPAALWEAMNGAPQPQDWQSWGAVFILAIVTSVFAFTLFQYCVRVAGASVTANFLYLMPVYGILLAVLLLGEELHLYHAVGFVVILAGVMMATHRPKVREAH